MPERSESKRAKGRKSQSEEVRYDGTKSVRVSFRLPRKYAPAFAERLRDPAEGPGECGKRLVILALGEFDQDALRRELEELRSQVRNARMDLAKLAVMVLTRDQTRPYTLAEAKAIVADILSS